MISPMLDAALELADRGLAVFPCRPRAKEPLTPHGFKDATTSPEIIGTWWRRWPQANVAVATGIVSGLVVLDVDPRNGGDDALAELVEQHGPLPETPRVFTGGGGEHFWFRHPGGAVACSSNIIGRGIDLKADGGYVIAPTSVHPSGRLYSFDVDAHPDEVPLADVPAWLIAAPSATVTARGADDWDGLLAEIQDGRRKRTLIAVAGHMFRRGVSESVIWHTLHALNETSCKPPLSAEDVDRLYAWTGKRELVRRGGHHAA